MFGMRFKNGKMKFFFFFSPFSEIQRHWGGWYVRRVSRIFFVWKDGGREGWKEGIFNTSSGEQRNISDF